MSREIKFRCWSEKEKSYIDEPGRFLWTSHDDATSGLYSPTDLQITLEQYTGLKDKNSKEIYEGDIVEGDMGVFEVKWYDLVAQFMFRPNIDMKWHPPFVYDQVNEMEVIGNVHENKELLDGSN